MFRYGKLAALFLKAYAIILIIASYAIHLHSRLALRIKIDYNRREYASDLYTCEGIASQLDHEPHLLKDIVCFARVYSEYRANTRLIIRPAAQ